MRRVRRDGNRGDARSAAPGDSTPGAPGRRCLDGRAARVQPEVPGAGREVQNRPAQVLLCGGTGANQRVICGVGDAVEVQVFADDGDPRLAAAVELVSPRNKDRPASRQAFAVKCVGYLQQGSSVVIVDTVTTRRADLNAALLSLLGVETTAVA